MIIVKRRAYSRVAGGRTRDEWRATSDDGSWGTLWKRTEAAAVASYERMAAMLEALDGRDRS